MLNTSADYKTAIAATDREMRGYVEFNGDSTKIMRGCDGLISIVTTAQIADEERPMFGCACASICEMTFYNSGLPAGVSLANSYFDAYVGIVLEDTGSAPLGSIEPDTATVEYVWMGRFIIDTIDRSKLSTKVTAYDDFTKLNKPYVCNVAETPAGYPINQIVGDIRTQCNLFASSTPSAPMGYVPKIYECTCRQMYGWVMSYFSLGCNMMARGGNVQNNYYTTVWGAYTHKDDAGHTITDDTIYMGGLADSPTFTFNSVVTGTEDNPVSVGSGTGIVGENPYFDAARATSLYNNINGLTFTPMTIEWRGDPAIQQGDVMKVVTGGNTYYTYVQRIVSTFNGGFKQTFECYGDSEYHYDMSTSPTQAQIKTAVSNMAQEIQQEIETADNGVITKVLDLDGSWKELVIANNQDLDSATSVWRWNINGLAHSTAYSGGTYNFAVDMNGRIIADVIQTGILQDAVGNNSWNLDTGALTITEGSINIVTNSETTDKIVLSHNEWTNGLSPLEWRLTNTSTNQELVGQAGSIYGYIYIGGVRTRTAQVSSAGDLILGANGSNGYIRLDGAANSMAYMRVTNGGEVGLADSSGTNIATIGGSNRSILLYDSSGNTAYQLDTPNRWLTINNSSNTRTVLLNGASGGINLSNGTQYMSYTAGSTFGIYNGTSKYTALIWPDANGAGQFVLGDGTGTKWRTTLTNTGLTFRDSSDTVTATYPSYGLYLQDFESKNLLPPVTSSYGSNGITYTPNANGTITVSGLASADSQRQLPVGSLPSGDYYFNGCPSGGSNSTYDVFIWDLTTRARCKAWDGTTDSASDKGSGTQFKMVGGHNVVVCLRVRSGQNINKVFSPMVRKAAVTDSTFVPWVRTQKEQDQALANLTLQSFSSKNIDDEQWRQGDWNNTTSSTRVSQVNTSRPFLKGGVSYTVTNSGYASYQWTSAFLATQQATTYIGGTSWTGQQSYTFTPEQDCYIAVIWRNNASTAITPSEIATNCKFMIRKTNNTDDTYVPLVKTAEQLTTMRPFEMADCFHQYIQVAGSISFTLKQGVYLVTIGKYSTTDANTNGLYVMTVYNSSSIYAIKSSSAATVSVSGYTVSVTSSQNYVEVSAIKVA